MSRSWAPLWNSIVDSSIWEEEYHVRVLFTSMLAIKDYEHICHGTPYQFKKRFNMTEEEVIDALKVLSSPDMKRTEVQEFEGRRIERVDGGWRILNGEKYNTMMRQAFLEHRRAYKAMKEKEYRRRRKEQAALAREAKMVGAQEAIQDGLNDLSESTKEPTAGLPSLDNSDPGCPL